MKKRVAIFANGWNSENLYRFTKGLIEHSPANSYDFFSFLCYATYNNTEKEIDSMGAIFDLPDLSYFDAAIIYTPGLNFTEMINKIYKKAAESGIPTISIGAKAEGCYYIGIDNYAGMFELTEHLVTKHNVKTIRYIAGSQENEDSNIRLKAIRECCEKYNLEFDDDQIFYSNWLLYPTGGYVDRLCESNDKLPDAIICANDILAELTNYRLTAHNYNCPKDVLVTGFDYMDDSQIFYPSIASVDQRYDLMGKTAVSIMNDIFEGKTPSKENLIECEYIPGESCGCIGCRNEEHLRRQYTSGVLERASVKSMTDDLTHKIERDLIEANDYDDLIIRLRRDFGEGAGYEGDTFFVILDSTIAKLPEKKIELLPKLQFAEELDVAVGKINGVPVKTRSIDTKALIPDYDGEGANHIYYFVPIFYEDFMCGYITITDKTQWIVEMGIFGCQKAFNDGLTTYRRNLQLSILNNVLLELMETDSLTKVKNRTAYDRYVLGMQRDFDMDKKSFKPFAAVFFDINNLKKVNDKLGHEKGDLYIKNSCKLICNIFKHSPVFRVGGDEFVSILRGSDFEKRYDLLIELSDIINGCQSRKDSMPPEECISIASGMAVYDEAEDEDIVSVFKRADKKMYVNKKIMKASMGETSR